MPRNAVTGDYEEVNDSWAPAVAGTPIDPDDWNTQYADFADTFGTDSLDRTGKGAMQANLDHGAFSSLYTEIVTPSNPAANILKVYAKDVGTVTKLASLNSAGTETVFGSGTGDVVGPATSTDNAIARFDSTTGKLIQDSTVTIADTTGNLVSNGTLTGTQLVSNIITGTAPLTVASTTQVANLYGARSVLADTVTVADAGGDTTTWPMLATSQTGNLAPATDAGLTFNATTNALTATTFIGAVTGNADTATALLNARTIGGVSFNGTANITVASATGGFTVSGGDLALGTNNITMSGSLAATGTRVTKGWFTDIESTNAGTIGGVAATGSQGYVRSTSPTITTATVLSPTIYTTAQVSVPGAVAAKIQTSGTVSDGGALFAVNNFTADANGPISQYIKSRNATPGSHTVVQNGDFLGFFSFYGDDGTNYVPAAYFSAKVDGTPGTTDMPGTIEIWTSPDGSSAPRVIATFPTIGVTSLFKGANVASASAIVPTGNIFHVTGTTNITSITSTGIVGGASITIIFDGVLTFTDGNNLKLAGNFVTTADDTISLSYDGTNWYEMCRSVN